MRKRSSFQIVALSLLLMPGGLLAQEGAEGALHIRALEQEHPELVELLHNIELAHGVLYGGLAAEGDAVRASGDVLPTFGFEFDMYDQLMLLVEGFADAEAVTAESDAGYAVLGPRATEVIRRTNDFHLELLGIYADRDLAERDRAVEAAVDRYLSRPEVALPAIPKDMDILYDHPHTWAFKTGYPDLIGFVWAGHWLQIAAIEPLMDAPTAEAVDAGIDTVMTRFVRKLSYGEAPDAFPTELPLTPSIAPGLVAMHSRAGAILDNLNMMHDVLSDVLVAPEVEDVRAAVDQVVEQFLDPTYRVVPRNDWIVMALRHSIFNQGGPALGIMTQTERNNSGHAQHLQGGGGRVVLPGMPGD